MNLPEHLANLTLQRGSMALLTEQRRHVGPVTCEGCNVTHPAGEARGVVVHEGPQQDAEAWLTWVLPDGWSVSDESAGGPMAVCPEHQAVPVLRGLRFALEEGSPG